MRILSISLALGISSLCVLSGTHAHAGQVRLRDCPEPTWDDHFNNCKVVDFHPAQPDIEAFEVSLKLSLPVAIAQYRTDFAIANAAPGRVGLLVLQYELQYEIDTPPASQLTSIQVSQVP